MRGWVAILVALTSVDAVFVKVNHNQPKCFIEMIRSEIVLVQYKSPDQAPLNPDNPSHVGLMLEVFSQDSRVFEGRTEQDGRFAFTTLAQGEHKLCFRWTRGCSYHNTLGSES